MIGCSWLVVNTSLYRARPQPGRESDCPLPEPRRLLRWSHTILPRICGHLPPHRWAPGLWAVGDLCGFLPVQGFGFGDRPTLAVSVAGAAGSRSLSQRAVCKPLASFGRCHSCWAGRFWRVWGTGCCALMFAGSSAEERRYGVLEEEARGEGGGPGAQVGCSFPFCQGSRGPETLSGCQF